jgi:CO dehydrogenase/acetyl-CoA synthase beta subunit
LEEEGEDEDEEEEEEEEEEQEEEEVLSCPCPVPGVFAAIGASKTGIGGGLIFFFSTILICLSVPFFKHQHWKFKGRGLDKSFSS